MAGKQRAVLVSLNISVWDAHSKDRELGHELAQSKNTSEKYVRVWKDLLPGCKSLGRLVSLRTQARRFHYSNTFPWQHRGVGMLPVKNFDSYTTKMQEYEQRFMEEVPSLTEEYESMQEELRAKLGLAYKETDYPPADSIKSRCRFEVVISPLPDGEIVLPEEIAEEERRRIERSARAGIEEAYREARKDLWERLHQVILDMEEKLSDPKGLRAASVKSMESMLGLLGRLNMDEDERFEQMRKDAESRLAAATGGAIKEAATIAVPTEIPTTPVITDGEPTLSRDWPGHAA